MGIASDFVLIVLAGLVGGLIARVLRVPLLVGYVAAGILVGPYTAGPTVVQLQDIERLAEIGVALLLFSLGLELSFRDLQPVSRIALIGAPIQIVLTCVAAAMMTAKFLGMPAAESIWFGSMNGGAIIDHGAPCERRFVAVQKLTTTLQFQKH